MFNNRKQSIPQRFIEKMEVDAKIENLLNRKVIPISEIPAIKEELAPLVAERNSLRVSCENFIKDQKAKGPLA